MKKIYIFLIFSSVVLSAFGQSECLDAQSDLNYAYSHVKSAYESNNLSHLKYYSKRSLDAFDRAKAYLENCNCRNSYDLAFKAHELLGKVENAELFEDGRFYVKRARELAQKSINEFEICSKYTIEDEALVELEYEREKLKEQQEKLRQKELEIKQQLLRKEQKELLLKKEKLIAINEEALTTNILAYNNMLSACECNSTVSRSSLSNENLLSKSIAQIKLFYLNSAKEITASYLSSLSQCKI